MKKKILAVALLAITSPFASAAPIILEGDFVRTAVSDDGTLGAGENADPGVKHDPSGTGTFGVDDYLTPGTPFEGFTVGANGSLYSNNNADYFPDSPDGDDISGSISDISGSSPFQHAVNFTGTVASIFEISTNIYFNDGDERIGMTTTITALSDLSDVIFGRYIDPDPDVNSFGVYETINSRGTDSLAPEDFVGSEGSITGLTLGLFTDSEVTHNTAIIGEAGGGLFWSDDPFDYLSGFDDGDGDHAIGIGFNIGDLMTGESSTFTYYYVMGDSIETIDVPTDVASPASLGLVLLSALGLGFIRNRKSK